ncbi:hypothetical protein [Pseudarthrobacter sp. BIM B-2242]|uniref:hypothetical protein n=1 Tax=Pseudarthrobacter sp. BIM B-2242 TaxID=2772401 RepID=UPI00168B8CF2|nr:hypothetical protein [Pseudarthrobacter sp. BIM B-2242]QOD02514.1 hypothetical protein IDT60_14275 [Pseudarthrobacter sp. BIM B-2242]
MRLLRQAAMPAAVTLALLTISSCSAGPQAEPTTPPTSQESTVTTSSCTGSGAYRIVPSINGSTPPLPHSGQGREFTPRIGLAGTKVDAMPPTANISIAADAPDPAPVFYDGMEVGSEATHNGYTIKVTSICDKEVLFDLVSQPK